VLTEPVPLSGAKIETVNHDYCISGKCNGLSGPAGQRLLEKIAVAEFRYWLKNNKQYSDLVKLLPVLDGAEVELFDPDTK
jgi:hypothetical protein